MIKDMINELEKKGEIIDIFPENVTWLENYSILNRTTSKQLLISATKMTHHPDNDLINYIKEGVRIITKRINDTILCRDNDFNDKDNLTHYYVERVHGQRFKENFLAINRTFEAFGPNSNKEYEFHSFLKLEETEEEVEDCLEAVFISYLEERIRIKLFKSQAPVSLEEELDSLKRMGDKQFIMQISELFTLADNYLVYRIAQKKNTELETENRKNRKIIKSQEKELDACNKKIKELNNEIEQYKKKNALNIIKLSANEDYYNQLYAGEKSEYKAKIKDLNSRIYNLEKENRLLSQQLENKDDVKQEVDNNHLDFEEAEVNNEGDDTLDNFLYLDKKLCFIFNQWNDKHNEILREFPNASVKTTHKAISSDVDLVIAMTTNMSHHLYYGVRSVCEKKDIPLIHCNNTNITKIKQTINDYYKNKEEK